MSEKIIVRQNTRYEIEFRATDPENPASEVYDPIHGLHEITPYGLLLVSIATCTAQVVLSYAQNHHIPLKAIELHMKYHQDSLESGQSDAHRKYPQEWVHEEIRLIGELDKDTKEKLYKISHQCPIVKMLEQGVPVQSSQLTT